MQSTTVNHVRRAHRAALSGRVDVPRGCLFRARAAVNAYTVLFRVRCMILFCTLSFFAEFIIWEGEIVRAKIESLFKGLNGCYKSWNDDVWAIGKDIKDELKIKMNKIYPYL